MVLTISTNTSALNVQRNLNEANEATASSLAKLSSGSRVPTSKDDAASLAIGSRLEAEIAGLNQASTNASQATSLLQIADGAYGEINDILVRQESLAIQSASGQLSDTERAIIDSEFQELSSEIDRIATDTEFNGNQLLNGGDITVSVNEANNGVMAAKGISVSFDANKIADLDTFETTYNATTQELTLTNHTTGESLTQDITADMQALTGDATTATDLANGQSVDVNFADLGVTVTLDSNFDRSTAIAATDPLTAAGGGAFDVTDSTVKFGEISLETLEADAGVTSGVLAINAANGADTISGTAGSTIQVSRNGGAAVTFDDGAAVTIADGDVFSFTTAAGDLIAEVTIGDYTQADAASAVLSLSSAADTTMFSADETAGATANFSFKVGTGTDSQDDISISVDALTTTALGTSGASVDTQANADLAIDSVKAAIDTLQGSRANIGASLSRLDFASSNLSVAIENQSAAKSGLMDVDMASETTTYAAQQVIVQAGVSLLAQANQQPSQLVSLIG